MIRTPNVGNSKGSKTKGKANRQVANLAINMNDNPNQNQGKTERQARAEAQNNTKKEVRANVMANKSTDGSINLQPQTITSIDKQRMIPHQFGHIRVIPRTVKKRIMTLFHLQLNQ